MTSLSTVPLGQVEIGSNISHNHSFIQDLVNHKWIILIGWTAQIHQNKPNYHQQITRIVCICPKVRTQCIFPRSQHTCLYIYWPKVNLYQVVFGQQSVWTLFKSLAQLFCKCSFLLKKCPPIAILDVQKSLLTISDQYQNFYFCDFFLQNRCRRPFWMSKTHFRWHFWPFQISPILDVRNSLLNAFLAIADQYATWKFLIKWLPSITFLAILDQYGI